MRESDDIQPWEKRDEETPAAFLAFRCYLDCGEYRSLRKAYVEYEAAKLRQQQASGDGTASGTQNGTNRAKTKSRPPDFFWGWSKRFEWADRAREYDRYVERQVQKAKLKKIEEMRSRHQQQCQFTLDLLLRPALALSQKYARNPQLLERMEDKELLRQFAIMTRRIPGIMGAERGALIGGNGQAPNVFEETKETDSQNQYILEVLPSNDGRAPFESNPDDDLESTD